MITDTFVNGIANAIAGQTYVYPNFVAYGTSEVESYEPDDDSVYGEIGTRGTITQSVSGNVASFTATRLSTDVITNTTGDDIGSVGLMATTSGDDLLAGVVVGSLTHTTNFNLETDIDVIIERRS